MRPRRRPPRYGGDAAKLVRDQSGTVHHISHQWFPCRRRGRALLQNLSRHFLLHNQNTLTHKTKVGGGREGWMEGCGGGAQGWIISPSISSSPPPSPIPPSSLPAPPSYGCSLPLTAGSDYGCEKWGSHANNPPLQHSCSMTAHFLPALPPARLPRPLPLFLPLSLCLSSAVLLFSSVCCFSHFHLNACAPARREKKQQLQVRVSSCAWLVGEKGGGGGLGGGGWKCVIAPKLVELLARESEKKQQPDDEGEETMGLLDSLRPSNLKDSSYKHNINTSGLQWSDHRILALCLLPPVGL